MDAELRKAIDEIALSVFSVKYIISEIERSMESNNAAIKDTEENGGEFRMAKMAGQYSGFMSMMETYVEMLKSNILDADAALRCINGEL